LHVAAEIRGHVARLGPQRVAELLGVRLCDLGPMLEGRSTRRSRRCSVSGKLRS